jgi:hypothetical protein
MILRGLSALALLLCVAVAALWLWSQWTNTGLAELSCNGRRWWLSSNSNGLFLVSQPDPLLHGRFVSATHSRWGGAMYSRLLFTDGVNESFGVAHWVALLAALPFCIPAIRWLGGAAADAVSRRRSEARRRAGLCTTCGFDLRASAVRCPECGTPTW